MCKVGETCLMDKTKPRCAVCSMAHCMTTVKLALRKDPQHYYGKLMCGTDHNTYPNLCALRKQACKSGKYINVRHPGACQGKDILLSIQPHISHAVAYQLQGRATANQKFDLGTKILWIHVGFLWIWWENGTSPHPLLRSLYSPEAMPIKFNKFMIGESRAVYSIVHSPLTSGVKT